MKNTTSALPFWCDEKDWIVTIQHVPDDPQERAEAAEAIGYMFGYANLTNTRMLALRGIKDEPVYELLFSFDSLENKSEFLRLFHANDATDVEDEMILVPTADEIAEAQPIAAVLPKDVVDQAIIIATATHPGSSGTVN
jgi:hypothetical protein